MTISIHALRVEGDCIERLQDELEITISIHALRVEGDRIVCFRASFRRRFLSTPSGWRATCFRSGGAASNSDFYPRPPGGGRPFPFSSTYMSIGHFYPRPPGGGRQQKRTKFSSVFAQKGEEFASLRRGKRKICRWRFKKDKFWVLIWCEGSGKSVCALASHCG